MLSQVSRTIAGFIVFFAVGLSYTESGSPHGGLIEGGDYLSESRVRVGTYSRGRNRRRGVGGYLSLYGLQEAQI